MQYPEQTDNYDVDIFNANFLELDTRDMAIEQALADEVNRATEAEQKNANNISAEESRASNRENIIESNFNAEAQAIRQLIDTAYASANGYTDTKIAQLINGAPSTLDTLKEIADALEDNADVVVALNSAIGSKANEVEFDSHVKDSAVHVTSAEKAYWNGKSDGNYASSAGNADTLDGKHASDFLPVNGGYINGTIHFVGSNQGIGANYGGDGWSIHGEGSAEDISLVLQVNDDLTEPIIARQQLWDGVTKREAYILDSNGNTSFPGTVTAAGFNGKASSASYADSAGSANYANSAGSVEYSNVNGRPTFSLEGNTLYINF